MNITLSGVAAAALMMVLSVGSQAKESCPAVSEIKQNSPGVFSATGENGTWNGNVQGNLTKTGSITAFDIATVTQEKEGAPQKLQFCTYTLSSGEKSNFYFNVKNGSTFTIKTEGDNWKKEVDGYGIIYNDCIGPDPKKCTFTLDEKPLQQ